MSIAVVLCNGATSFRCASDSQKKRFRSLTRLATGKKDKTAARDIDLYATRERGVSKAIAVVFAFDERHAPSGPSHFLLPVWRPKEADVLAEHRMRTLGVVMEFVLGSERLLKLTFDAKELLCVLMRFLGWDHATIPQRLVDVQMGAWLLQPDPDKERAQYQLLPLLQSFCAFTSEYPIDVSDNPADVMRGLAEDLVDVRERLWPAMQQQLQLADLEGMLVDLVSRTQHTHSLATRRRLPALTAQCSRVTFRRRCRWCLCSRRCSAAVCASMARTPVAPTSWPTTSSWRRSAQHRSCIRLRSFIA